MARGLPDYGLASGNVSAAQVDGSAIIAGLRGVQSVDGTGRPYLVDDFSRGLSGWLLYGNGGALPVLDNSYLAVYNPPVGVKFDIGVGAISAYMRRDIGYNQEGRYGAEVAVRLGEDAGSFSMTLGKLNGQGQEYTGSIYFTASVRKWYISLPDSASLEVLDWSSLPYMPTGWVSIKLVIDTVSGKYIRLIVGDLSIPVTAYNLRSNVGDDGLEFSVNLSAAVIGSKADPVYLGYVILTQDEP